MLTEKGFSGLIGKIQRAEGTLRSLFQEAIEDALTYAIDRQEQGHGLDLRRLSIVQTTAKGMKSVNNQRLSDYIKTCLLDSNGKTAIGWNDKDQQYKLLTKGTIACVPSFETRGTWFEFGKPEKVKDDFNFAKSLENFLKQVSKHEHELAPEDVTIINAIRSARQQVNVRPASTDELGNPV